MPLKYTPFLNIQILLTDSQRYGHTLVQQYLDNFREIYFVFLEIEENDVCKIYKVKKITGSWKKKEVVGFVVFSQRLFSYI